jgi:hypothetical protein
MAASSSRSVARSSLRPWVASQRRKSASWASFCDVAARQAVERALAALEAVGQAAHHRGVAHHRFRVGCGGGADHGDVGLGLGDAPGQLHIACGAHLGGQAVALGAAGIAGQQDGVVLAQAGGGHREEVARPVGDVVGRGVGGAAVAADIGTQEGEVAGVARPFEVVHLAAVVADALGRRIHQPHVADHQLAHAVVAQPAMKARHGAAVGRVLLAGRDQRLDALLDLRMPLGTAQRRRQPAGHLGGDVVDAVGDIEPLGAAGRQLLGTAAGQEALGHQVALRRRIALDGAEGAMVVGDYQALGRHEGAGAAAERHHGAQRVPGHIGQLACGQLNAELLEPRGELGQLLRHPLAFVCEGRQGRQRRQGEQAQQPP